MQEFLQQLVNGLSVGAIYALIAVGYTMVYGVLQLINFAHSDVFMVAPMIAMYAATGRLPESMPIWVHILLIALLVISGSIAHFHKMPPILIARKLAIPTIAYLVFLGLVFIVGRFTRGGLPSPSWLSFAESTLVALVTCGVLGFCIER